MIFDNLITLLNWSSLHNIPPKSNYWVSHMKNCLQFISSIYETSIIEYMKFQRKVTTYYNSFLVISTFGVTHLNYMHARKIGIKFWVMSGANTACPWPILSQYCLLRLSLACYKKKNFFFYYLYSIYFTIEDSIKPIIELWSN